MSIAEQQPRAMANESEAMPLPTTRSRRWKRWICGAAILAGVVWFLPLIVAATPLRQQIVPIALPGFEGSVRIGSASLAWFSPIELHDIEILDDQGQPIANSQTIATKKTLYSLLVDSSNIGELTIAQPQLQAVMRLGGSNIEDAIAPLVAGPATDERFQCTINIEDGSVLLSGHNANDGQTKIDSINATIKCTSNESTVIEAEVSATVAGSAGTITSDVTWQSGSEIDSSIGRGSVNVTTKSLPLPALHSMFDRIGVVAHLSGSVDSEMQLEWNDENDVSVSGRLDAKRFTAEIPQLLGTDQFESDVVEISGDLRLLDGQLKLEHTTLKTEVASLAATGVIDLSELNESESLDAIAALLGSHDFEISGKCNLQKLASSFPETIRIREGAVIESGTTEFSLASHNTDGQRSWTARIESKGFKAVVDGKTLSWQKPVVVSIRAHVSDDGVVLDELTGTADFMQLKGHGTLDQGHVSFNADLDRLFAQIQPIFDLGDLRFAGQVASRIDLKSLDRNAVQAKGDMTLTDFQLVIPNARPLSEKQLKVVFDAKGLVKDNRLHSIEHGKFTLASGNDQLRIDFLDPVLTSQMTSRWKVKLSVTGELRTWQPRLETFMTSGGQELDGNITLDLTLTMEAETARFEQTKLVVTPFRFKNDMVNIDESELVLEGSGSWDQRHSQLTLPNTTIVTDTVAVRAVDLVLTWPENAEPIVSSGVAIRGELDRIASWFRSPGADPPYRVHGIATAQIKLSHSENVSSATYKVDVNNMRLTDLDSDSKSQTLWQEKRMTIAGQGNFRHENESFDLRRLQVTTDSVALNVRGSINDLNSELRVDLKGDINYDTAMLVERLRGMLGEGITITGRQQRQFSMAGPLFAPAKTEFSNSLPRELTANAGLGWDSADIYGLLAGSGSIDARLSRQVLSVAPIDMTVSGGRLTCAPRIHFDGKQPRLIVGKGPFIQNVALSPELCGRWLKYLAPLLADSTQVDGKFSMSLSGADVPLSTPSTGTVGGVLAVHSAKIRPGGLAAALVSLATQIEAIITRRAPRPPADRDGPLLSIDKQNIEFQIANGRVHHKGLQLTVQGVVIRTHGSVGFDESLAIVAEVPIQDAWIKSSEFLAGLKGRSITIPVSGTLSKPQIDDRALSQLLRQLTETATKSLLEDQLQKQLRRLFKK